MSSDNKQLGDLATQLVTESRRSTATDTLFKYNDTLVRTLIREQRGLEALITNALDSMPDNPNANQVPPSFIIHQTTLMRNKRCLLAYHQHRMNFLKSLYWSLGGALPPILSNSQIRANLAPHEVDFIREYNTMVVDFRADFTDELDITSSILHPPKDIHVLVRVVRDCGVIETELGAIDFQKGQRFMVRRADVEHLLVQGYLEEITS
ncbi:DNA replication complex GINS protein PSF1 [Fomitiporia mediterranea MF3/22]|uniref:DNA replication complex GINS protein PSF1 n=1 Tax=Fomitiporia mediterranea (strain MF3/22) TaxID=694068 RepID=UPI0004407ED1|nr:DNA replication complex GINS protein PSF1 [Fomitiporia mediterranea MF3/22]EJD08514.1 DNA replication complex GINS protein PSF1 [Fomitiporia mediterranea MF3/22]